jgi:arginine deiminase
LGETLVTGGIDMNVSRRTAIGGMVAGAAALAIPAAARTSSVAASSFVPTDIGTLKRVLVHSIAVDDRGGDRLDSGLLPYVESDMAVAADQQAGLIKLLKANGADVVELKDALSTAIAATRGSGVFAAWLEASFPLLAGDPAKVGADTILGRDPAFRNRLAANGDWRHFADDINGGTMWTRDSAMMSPNGLVMGRSVSLRRRRENHLLRFCYAHSPLLDRYPVVFDAMEEGIGLEGGDFTVVDRNTIFLGHGNRTDPRIAPLLAQRLNMDVLAVQTVKRDFIRPARLGVQVPMLELQLLLLHLDTYFTLVAPGHALTVPYLLEKERAEDNPLARYIRGARAQNMLDEEEAEKGLTMLKEFGKVKLCRAGTGKVDDLGDIKLVDYLKGKGYRFTWVGGARPAGDQGAYAAFMETAYPELRRQASNIVQARPGRVIAYAGNPATKAALEADGLAVDTFPARELWQWHGGPHCLTQPLERV